MTQFIEVTDSLRTEKIRLNVAAIAYYGTDGRDMVIQLVTGGRLVVIEDIPTVDALIRDVLKGSVVSSG